MLPQSSNSGTKNIETKNISSIFCSPVMQKCTGLLLGIGCYSLAEKSLRVLSPYFCSSVSTGNPFASLSLLTKIALTPVYCMSGAIWEEDFFRGNLTDTLTRTFTSMYGRCCGEKYATHLGKISAIFSCSILYSLMQCLWFFVGNPNPVALIPQFIINVFLGCLFSLAAEMTGRLNVSAGMNVMYKTLQWLS